MCLMQTDLPVPDGPMIIEILPSGRPMLRPRSTWLRPKDLCTSMNSIASGACDGRMIPVWNSYSSSSLRPEPLAGCSAAMSASDRGSWIGAPEHLGAEHSDQVHEDQV